MSETTAAKTEIVVRRVADGTVAHRIDVTGKRAEDVERIERGLAINFDFSRYMFATEAAHE